jgi:hypothetical protein
MKKHILLASLFIGSCISVKAQEDVTPSADDAVRNEKIYPLYVAYVTKELTLTTEEAQKFWPVHAQFENELKAVKKDLPELEKEQLKLNIKKKYQSNFSGILGSKRCDNFFRMRGAFQRRLIERWKNRKQAGIRQGGGGMRRGQ